MWTSIVEGQVVLNLLAEETQFRITPWLDSALVPAYISLASLGWLGISAARKFIRKEAQSAKVTVQPNTTVRIYAYLKQAGCLALFGLSLTTAIQGKKWLLSDIAWCLTYLYLSALGIASLTSFSPKSGPLQSLLLLFTFIAFSYRNVYPLITYDLVPLDLFEGPILWAKAAVLFFVAVAIPLISPRQYVPAYTGLVVAPEQDCSYLSLVLFAFLNKTVDLAGRVKHLKAEDLPPICDTDTSRFIREKGFAYVSPASGAPKDRRLLWGIVIFFRRDIFEMVFTVFCQVSFLFMSPIAINRLLNYVESGGVGTRVRPWFWLILMALGGAGGMTSGNRYMFLNSRLAMRLQCLLTQVLYDHTMKVRVKAETRSTPTSSITIATTDESGSETVASDDDEASTTSSTLKPKAPVVEEPAPRDKSGDFMGKLNNLISTDMDNVTDSKEVLLLLTHVPLVLVGAVIFLYNVLGWSAFVGIFTMFLLLPIPGKIAKMNHAFQAKRMKATDARVQSVSDSMSVLRMIKLFGWEVKTEKRISEKRDDELKWVRRMGILYASGNVISDLLPVITIITTFFVYTVVMKQELHASKIFSSMTAFDHLKNCMRRSVRLTNQAITGKISMDRIDAFLHDTELIDAFEEKTSELEVFTPAQPEHDDIIGFEDAVFTWTSAITDGSLTPSRRAFRLQINGRIEFQKGCVNLVVGATGSGKTSLLMALLGEMHMIPSATAWKNLPRQGGVAYAAQQSWVQNDTIKNNIVFGSIFDEERYKQVLFQVGLERDLELFAAGDNTEVGEKGLTLSGGQKARITLARAIYSTAEIILLDDILAALDVHTARWIVEKCLTGDLVRGRTVIMVTHNIALASPIASFVVALTVDGRILSQGTIEDAVAKDKKLAAEVKADKKAVAAAEKEAVAKIDDSLPAEADAADGKLVLAEEIEQGRVGRDALKLLLSSLGGKRSFIFWSSFLLSLTLQKTANIVQTGWLGIWANQYDERAASEVNAIHYLGVFILIAIGSSMLEVTTSLVWLHGRIRLSRTVHTKLTSAVLGSTLRWLDETPTSRIISRCTRDIRSIDGPVTIELFDFFWITVQILLRLSAVVVLAPAFFIPGVGIALIANWVGQRYLKAALSAKRELSVASAPVLSQFELAIHGLISIRAYNVQDNFRNIFMKRTDEYTRTARTFYSLNQYVSCRIDSLSTLFTTGLATYLIYGPYDGSSAQLGFSLNMAVGFSGMILWWIRTVNEFEVACNSLERISSYLTIDQEPKPTKEGVPPAYWPASGDLKVEGLSARYSKTGPKVLTDVSFHIKSGERVGIVGRTGSGKSSLTLSLLRCILNTEGEVYIDGLPTSSINLDRLRESVTIIPQVPELLVGSLRENLDPFGENDDAVLNAALRSSGLFSLEADMEDGQLTLDSAISSGGGNLSIGQRQILALARAIIRNSKLLILDEATSAIDYKTDEVIQASLRHQLSKDATILTVAHRLASIMDSDKIMVLDAGRIVEFGSPRELLKNEKGLLRSLVDESGDKEALLAMVPA